VLTRVPELRARAAYAQQAIRGKLLDHKEYIMRHGDDLPEIRDWKWSGRPADARGSRGRRRADTAADNL